MDARMFTLVSESDARQIFAWGMEIIDGDQVEAVIYRRDPHGRAMFGLHANADAARARFGRSVPLRVHWEDDFGDELSEQTPPDDLAEAAELVRPRR
jgi:hypothetical protein